MQQQLSDTARDFLQAQRFAVLATINRNGTPQQSIVWYELQDDEILMNTKRGRVKDRNLRHDPRCSICVADGYRYITIRGTVEIDHDQDVAQADIARLAVLNHGSEVAERQMADQFSKEERVTIRMSIERVHEYGLR